MPTSAPPYSNLFWSPRLLKPLFRIPGMLNLIRRRMQHHRGPVLLELFGIILATGLITNAAFFSEGVDRVILAQELAEFSRVTGRPAFSTSAYILPNNQAPFSLEKAEGFADQVGQTISAQVGLPLRSQGLKVSSGLMLLAPDPESGRYTSAAEKLAEVEVVYIAEVARQMEITGGMALDETNASGAFLDIWMHDTLFQQIAAQVGDIFRLRSAVDAWDIPVRLSGVWRARDAQDEFWFNNPDSHLKQALLVRRQDYLRFVQPVLPSRTREISWHVILDDQDILPQRSAAYLAGFSHAQEKLKRLISGIRLNTPPIDPLASFVQRSRTLTILLMTYNLPALGILLYFLLLLASISTAWRSRETATMLSRGMNGWSILSLVLGEHLLLCLVGFPLGLAFGMLVARLMGYTTSFLSFTTRPPLPVSPYGASLPLVGLAFAISLVSRLGAEMRLVRTSVVTEEREWARPIRKPLWYRAYFDLLLLVPVGYAYQQLLRHGTLAGLISERPQDLWRDPLLILMPGLFIVTASMLVIRLATWALHLIDRLAGRIPWLAPHLALRELGRQAHEHIHPLLLVIISLSLGVYTLAMAASLDGWLEDRVYYRSGADLAIQPRSLLDNSQVSDWNWIPTPDEFLKINGVLHAARVGKYRAILNLEPREYRGRFLAIDRADFAKVAWVRPDFAYESLGGLMNRLALVPNGILAPESLLARVGLNIGDPIRVTIHIPTVAYTEMTFSIAGVYRYFPTVYEEEDEGLTLIGNLDQLSANIGLTLPHEMWLKLEPGITGADVLQALPVHFGLGGILMADARASLAQEQARLERVGIFGTLTAGFLASALMALLGLWLSSYASLSERASRFAILHALGLPRSLIVLQVMLEYACLSLFGALAGLWIGSAAAQLFIPFFRYTGETGIPLPPLIPIVAVEPMRALALGFTALIVLSEAGIIASVLRRGWVQIR